MAVATTSGPRGPVLLVVAMICALGVGAGGGDSESAEPAEAERLSAAAQLGEKIFHDPSLSASGRVSCATCHDPAHAHAAGDGLAVSFGGASLADAGFRNAPSLRYLSLTPSFYFDAAGTPTGGFDRDGRAATLAEQAQRPFLAEHEMANRDGGKVVEKLKRTAYVEEFRATFGMAILHDSDQAFERMLFALAQYQKEDPEFRPFDSKYDYFLAGQAQLSEQELRGLSLFNKPDKGNCAACHPSTKGVDGAPPLFTDFTYDNVGVPRNYDIPATADSNYYDLGLCGPERSDLAERKDLCGAFKVPTLRNIAATAPYFHNGRFKTLQEVVAFYVRRDTNPGEWYPVGSDGVVKFDDLPAEYRGNVNTSEKPYNRKPGEAPALTAQEIDDVVAFLNTLSDGYQP